MNTVSALDSGSDRVRTPPSPQRLRRDAGHSRVQAELEVRNSELRHLRESLREETRRREAAEAALAEARRQHAAELARLSRSSATGEMAGALAHQLGQPLAATLNYLHGCQLRLQHDNFDADAFQAALALAIEHVEQAGGIVGHVRNFVARHVPDSRAVDLHALIRQTSALLDADCRQHGIEVVMDLAPGTPEALVDPLEVQQVLLNLMRNAVDAMTAIDGPPRRLTLRTQVPAHGRRIEIEVADSGPGISASDLPRIFESWYTTKRNGLGLGLAVCRTIVESHGGTLRVQPGHAGGATFRFDLTLVSRA